MTHQRDDSRSNPSQTDFWSPRVAATTTRRRAIASTRDDGDDGDDRDAVGAETRGVVGVRDDDDDDDDDDDEDFSLTPTRRESATLERARDDDGDANDDDDDDDGETRRDDGVVHRGVDARTRGRFGTGSTTSS